MIVKPPEENGDHSEPTVKKSKRRDRMRQMCFELCAEFPTASPDLVLSAVMACGGKDRDMAKKIIMDSINGGGSPSSSSSAAAAAASFAFAGKIKDSTRKKGVLERLFDEDSYKWEAFDIENSSTMTDVPAVRSMGAQLQQIDLDKPLHFRHQRLQQQQRQKHEKSETWDEEKLRMVQDLQTLFPDESEQTLRLVLLDKKFNLDNAMEELFYRQEMEALEKEEVVEEEEEEDGVPTISAPVFQFNVDNDNNEDDSGASNEVDTPHGQDQDSDENNLCEESDDDHDDVVELEISPEEYRDLIAQDDDYDENGAPLAQVVEDLQLTNDEELARQLQKQELAAIDHRLRRRVLRMYRPPKKTTS